MTRTGNSSRAWSGCRIGRSRCVRPFGIVFRAYASRTARTEIAVHSLTLSYRATPESPRPVKSRPGTRPSSRNGPAKRKPGLRGRAWRAEAATRPRPVNRSARAALRRRHAPLHHGDGLVEILDAGHHRLVGPGHGVHLGPRLLESRQQLVQILTALSPGDGRETGERQSQDGRDHVALHVSPP